MRPVILFFMLMACVPHRLHAAVVCNAGVPGENSAQVLRRLPNALADCPRAGTVVLFAGMNDAVNERRFQTPQQTFASVSAILKAAAGEHANTIAVLVHMPDESRLMQRHTLESYGARGPGQRIDDTNAAIRMAAERQGARVVDFHQILQRAGGANAHLSTDGVHLTARGYSLLAVAVALALPSHAHESRVLCLGDSLTYGTGVRGPQAIDDGSESYPQQLGRLLRLRESRRGSMGPASRR